MLQLLSASETLYALKNHLSAASSIQIAVAFLSQSGLDQLNPELERVISLGEASEAAVNSLEAFDSLKQLPDVSPLTSSILNIFEDYAGAAKKVKNPISDEMKALSKMLDTEIAQHQQAVEHEPFEGWLGLVFDYVEKAISGDTFENQDLYEFKDEFRQQYPYNKNIEAKIRQQLQILAKRGYLEDVGRSRWRKVNITT